MKKVNWKVLGVSLFIVLVVSFIGGLFTDTTGWYNSVKPSITPPNYVFPIVWTILFIMIGISIYFAWISSKNKQKNMVITLFSINLILNILWSFIFFTLKNPMLAFFELILLWISILILVIQLYKVNKIASWLLVPYLIWVSFAGILTYIIAFS
ncbi:MAG: TspO/MBR family protein [Candidatus Pacearchaeota archaeon]|jgi:tryptophan-rich sensory protein